MPLRDYQEQAVHELRAAVRRSGSVVYQLATGAGKTPVAGEIARLASEKGSRTFFLCHRRELIKQAVDTFTELCPNVQLGVEAAGWPTLPWAPLQVGSVQSVARRQNIKAPDLVIWDEVHHVRAATWEKIYKQWPNAKHIGLTATPERTDGKGLGAVFAELVQGPSIEWLQTTINPETGLTYLAPCQVLRIPARVIEENIDEGVVADAVNAYLRYAKGRPAIFFGKHIDHSRKVCEGLRAAGIRAEHVDGTDSTARRDLVMNGLKTGGIDVVGNVALIDEGFDCQRCDVVMDGAPTKSVTRYLQRAGRAMRPASNKTALILDLAGNSYDLGLPTDTREWSLEDGEILDGKKSRPKPRDCARCYTMFWGRICPNCAYSEPLGEVSEVETELEVATGAAARASKGGRRADLNRELAMAHRATDPAAAVVEIGKRRGYKPGWAQHIVRLWQMKEA